MARHAPSREDDLARAVRDLLQAEQNFTRAYGAWLRAAPDERPALRVEVERAEHSVDVAQRDVIRRQH